MQRVNEDLIAQFRSNAGTIVEGMFQGVPILLLSTSGARSGRICVTPLAHTRDGARYVIVASNGGAPRHPDWYYNVVANPIVTVEVGRECFAARASVADHTERDRLFEAHAQMMPPFREYERMTSRRIPVVVLDRVDQHSADSGEDVVS
jgi:deazaflavin-dependent oxidoreductase (nitroreductase family)